MDAPRPLVVINVVGLTHAMLGPETPNISAVAADGFARPLGTVLPAVTCSAQSTLLTGLLPRDHGIVGNVSRNAISVAGGPIGHGTFIGTRGGVP